MRILLLSRHFPPAISGAARRVYFLARGLQEAGAEIFLVAPDRHPEFGGLAVPHPNRDPAPSPQATRRSLRDDAREWLLWPDADIRWARRAAYAAPGAMAVAGFTPDWILTTSPPESVHAAGAQLKGATGARWAADFRDHWIQHAKRASLTNPLRRAGERVMARRILHSADLIFGVNNAIAAEMGAFAPRTPARTLGHMAPPPVPPEPLDPGLLHLVHTGSFSLSDPLCPISPVLAAFAEAHARQPLLRLHLAGWLTPEEQAAVRSNPAAAAIRVYGPVPLERSLALQAAADGLIATARPGCPFPPGKYWEYRLHPAPIIPVGKGPWIAVCGLDAGPAAEAMTAVAKRRPFPAPTGHLTPAEAARHLLDWLREAM